MITGKIEKIDKSEGIGKTGKPYTRWVFTIEGKKYSTFDVAIGDKFKAGQVVTMTGEQRGEYWNMETMVVAVDPKEEFYNEDRGKPQDATNTETNDLLRQILAELKDVARVQRRD